jgi:hypothetical protein
LLACLIRSFDKRFCWQDFTSHKVTCLSLLRNNMESLFQTLLTLFTNSFLHLNFASTPLFYHAQFKLRILVKLFWWTLYFNDNASLVAFSLAILCKRGVWTWLWTIIIWVFKALLIYIALGWFISLATRFNFLATWRIINLGMNMVFLPWLKLYGYIEINQSSCKYGV